MYVLRNNTLFKAEIPSSILGKINVELFKVGFYIVPSEL